MCDHICVYIYICMLVEMHTYLPTYIHIFQIPDDNRNSGRRHSIAERERETEREREGERERESECEDKTTRERGRETEREREGWGEGGEWMQHKNNCSCVP